MVEFTSGKFAKAMCDRCGDKVDYLDLKEEWTGLKVCEVCWDAKTKQEFPTNFPNDPEALRDPRPDNDVEAGAGYISVPLTIPSNFNDFELEVELGDVTVSVA